MLDPVISTLLAFMSFKNKNWPPVVWLNLAVGPKNKSRPYKPLLALILPPASMLFVTLKLVKG